MDQQIANYGLNILKIIDLEFGFWNFDLGA